MTISSPSCYLPVVKAFNSQSSTPAALIDPIISLEQKAHKGLESALREKLEKLPATHLIQVLEGVFERSHSNEMVATLKKIVTTTAVQNILTQKNLSRDIPLFIENYTRFLPVTCSHREPITLKQGFLQSLGWVGKLLNTLFFTFTGSYNIDVDNPPKDQYRTQSQMMFLRAAISDALLNASLT